MTFPNKNTRGRGRAASIGAPLDRITDEINGQPAINGYILPVIDPLNFQQELRPLYFQFTPQIASDSKRSNYRSVDILGRAEPIQIYQSGGERKIGLELTYAVFDGTQSGVNFQPYPREGVPVTSSKKSAFDYDDILNTIDFFNSLQLPVTLGADSAYIPPPMIWLNYGERYVNLPCVVNSVNLKYPEDAPLQRIVGPNGAREIPSYFKATLDLVVFNYYGDSNSLSVDLSMAEETSAEGTTPTGGNSNSNILISPASRQIS